MSKITIDTKELENEFAAIPSVSMAKTVAEGIIFGKNYQIQVVITTDESDFMSIHE